jgi:hypothetical protein
MPPGANRKELTIPTEKRQEKEAPAKKIGVTLPEPVVKRRQPSNRNITNIHHYFWIASTFCEKFLKNITFCVFVDNLSYI